MFGIEPSLQTASVSKVYCFCLRDRQASIERQGSFNCMCFIDLWRKAARIGSNCHIYA